jgi:flavin reductase (DIM6/NTAB) family NADH-FMN oxidoreductase RutF
MHKNIAPAIHYWGTPVVLISTLNPDGSVNVAPMSSAWWLGWSCMLGFDASSQTVANLIRDRECVLNLASTETAEAVNRLARTTGSRAVPLHKRAMGWRYESAKLAHAGLTAIASLSVKPPRVAECLVQLEAIVVAIRPFAKRDPRMAIPACAVEVQIVQTHVEESLLRDADKIDADKWRPLVMSFRELFVLGDRIPRSRLAAGEESMWAPWKRGPLARVAAKAYGLVAEHRYGVDDDDDGVK